MRDKKAPRDETLALGRQLREATTRAGALLIINDDVTLAEELNADGVHVGQKDAAAKQVRARVHVLGVSCGTPEEAIQAAADDADYIGCGNIFATMN